MPSRAVTVTELRHLRAHSMADNYGKGHPKNHLCGPMWPNPNPCSVAGKRSRKGGKKGEDTHTQAKPEGAGFSMCHAQDYDSGYGKGYGLALGVLARCRSSSKCLVLCRRAPEQFKHGKLQCRQKVNEV